MRSQLDASSVPWYALGDILTQLTASEDVNADINAALAQLGSNLLVSRLGAFRYHQHPVSEDPLASYRWEWCSATVEPQLNNLELQNVTLQQLPPQWHERLHQGQWAQYGCAAVDAALSEDLGEGEAAAASGDMVHPGPDWFLRVQQVCWAIAVPIPIGGRLWGFLMAGRDQTQCPWQGTERVMLQTVACGLGNAIARHQSQVALRSFNEQIESVIQQRTFKFRAAIQQLQQEIRDRQRAEDQLRYTTFHDALTGLPNRMSLIHTLNQVIAEVQLPMAPEVQAQRVIALVLIDIDRLEVVNNTMGHAMGDELLAAIADRLQRQLPDDYFVARFGGDEFAILAEGVATMPAAEQLASRVQALFLQAFPVDDQDLFTSVTLGIALSDPDYKRPESMLRDADIAMRRAKRTGGGNYAIFDRTIHQHAITDLYLETELRRAIQALGMDPTHPDSGAANCQFFLTYQPVVETQTQVIRGFEALVRWQHPDLGLVSPAQFIPIAEKTGAIVPLGNWILYQACRQLQQWQAQDPKAIAPLEMAVNLSCRQFAQPDLIAQVERAIADHQIAPETLKLEITESTIMEGSNLAKRTLAALQSRGMQLCMDDFGTGYSSLSYLHRLPLDVLKIDRAFVVRLGQRGENTAIIRTIITLAQHFGLKVVAEGVETTQQLKLLRSLGCEFVQGYLFSRPLSAAEATELLGQQRRDPNRLWVEDVRQESAHQA
jgi:diguanylate cyclase (GGDEF)-like protein